ncbi:MAG: phosphodiesterase [Rhodobacterales bacterium]|nr:MAG: phosphodiesterase [Rhodobacterales bacterium]
MTLAPSFLTHPLAHRGLHDAKAPENSRAAIRAAKEAGYGIEIDIQPSRDGVPMVFHDYDLRRLTPEQGPIQARSAAELAAIPLWGATSETVPTLREVLDLVDGKVPLLIELKDQDGALGASLSGLEQAVAEVVSGYTGDVALMGFNPNAMQVLSRITDHPVGLTTCAFTAEDWPTVPAPTRERLAGIPDYDISGACFISHDQGDLGSARVEELKRLGAPVLCWTVRSPEEEAKARDVADNITFERYRPEQ